MIEHNFKKKFGQNFLIDNNIINKIVSAANVEKDSLIIEIGPGAGALTKELVKKGTVIAYEIDTDLKLFLEKEFGNLDNIEFVFDDFLNRNIKNDIQKYNYKNVYIIANLPYYITTPIINKVIEENINIEKLVIMVQKEVGDRFSAQPKSKEYSSITVFLNYYFDIKKEFIVSKNCFMPKPNIDSMVISLTRKKKQNKAIDESKFFKLVRDSFKYKRKTLKNNLKEYNFKKVNEVLKKHEIRDDVRAESISLDIFIEISNNL